MKISGEIPNLINGVSQQPPALRLSSQLESQENCYSTVVDGLIKRPPTNRVARLWETTAPFVSPLRIIRSHIINRDEREKYVVSLVREGVGTPFLAIHDFQGNRKTLNAPGGQQYLLGIEDFDDVKIMTVADYSFVLNKTQQVAIGGTLAPTRPKEALVHVMAGNYGRTYEILINGATAAWYRTPDGGQELEGPFVDTSHIIDRLIGGEAGAPDSKDHATPGQSKGLQAHGYTAANGWYAYRFQNALHIFRTDNVDFRISCVDGYGGRAMVAIKEKVQDFSVMPNFAPSGFVCEIEGAPTNDYDNYWVSFEQQDTSGLVGSGVWKETPKPGTPINLNPATMPHVLVREANGTFTFRPQEWSVRRSGSEVVTPGPSFVGRTIKDVFFFKNRLGFLSDENVVMSRAGEFWDFYRTTATALLDDDPIDVGASHTRVSLLEHAVPFQDRLMLFSPYTQFLLKGQDLLTPKTVSIQPQTEFESSPLSAPVSSGRNVFFTVRRGEYTMVREYALSDDGVIGDAEDITSHAPQYVPRNVDKLEASTHEDILVAGSADDPSSLFIYKWFVSGDRKLQSSWSRWTFPDCSKIHSATFVESSLYVVVQRSDEVALERIDLQPNLADEGSPFVIHLDRRQLMPAPAGRFYNVLDDTTHITTPYKPNPATVVVTAAGGGLPEGLLYKPIYITETQVVVRGNHVNDPLWVGATYRSSIRLSPIFLRKSDQNGGQRTLTEGRLQLITGFLQYSATGYLRVEVTPQARPTNTYTFNGRNIGSPENIVGAAVLGNGTFRFPILSKNDRVNIDIINDSYLPMSLTAIEWIGSFNTKARRT